MSIWLDKSTSKCYILFIASNEADTLERQPMLNINASRLHIEQTFNVTIGDIKWPYIITEIKSSCLMVAKPMSVEFIDPFSTPTHSFSIPKADAQITKVRFTAKTNRWYVDGKAITFEPPHFIMGDVDSNACFVDLKEPEQEGVL